MSNTVPPRRLLRVAVGFTIWASALVTLYGLNAIGCEFGWQQGLQRGILLLLFALHVVALMWITARYRRHRSPKDAPIAFLEYVGVGTVIAALAATLFTFAPLLVLRLCL